MTLKRDVEQFVVTQEGVAGTDCWSHALAQILVSQAAGTVHVSVHPDVPPTAQHGLADQRRGWVCSGRLKNHFIP